jgi:hypothetical protein
MSGVKTTCLSCFDLDSTEKANHSQSQKSIIQESSMRKGNRNAPEERRRLPEYDIQPELLDSFSLVNSRFHDEICTPAS